MLDIQYVKSHTNDLKQNLKNRNLDPSLVDALLASEQERSSIRKQIEEQNFKRNETAKKLQNIKDKTSPEAQNAIEEGRKIKDMIAQLELAFKPVDEAYMQLMYKMPNIYLEDVPVGKNEDENVVIRKVGTPPTFTFTIKDHIELGEKLNIIDNDRAAKVSGARFTYLKGGLAAMQFGLAQFAFATLANRNIIASIIKENNLQIKDTPFTPIIPPVMIKTEVMAKMGRLEPREDRYGLTLDDMYLVGSAEHTLGPLYMDEILEEAQLPIRYIGYSTAFRREAGSYGKDTKGIIRMHQFDKLEMETFALPETSMDEQILLVKLQEYLMQSLKLPYQVVANCTGDMGTPDARQFDIETWMPGQGKYRETHSSDLMTDYQSRRLNIRVKRLDGKYQFVHMNDATTFAIGRTIVAIMENYQQKDGSIKVPDVLLPYVEPIIQNTIITAS